MATFDDWKIIDAGGTGIFNIPRRRGVILLGAMFNLLTAVLSLVTILLYSLLYTLWLKPKTPYNIVIGGAAGAMAPVGAWAAATGSMPPPAWVLFLIVFFWTPRISGRWRFVSRMTIGGPDCLWMPVAKGQKATHRQILLYSVALFLTTFVYGAVGGGWLYIIAASLLGVLFMVRVLVAAAIATRKEWQRLFTFSIIYLSGLFAVMIAERLLA